MDGTALLHINTATFFAHHHLNPTLSATLVYGVGLGVPLLLTLVALILGARQRRWARQAEAACAADAPLTAGPAVVHGEVELDPDEALAVRVEIHQRGEEEESSGAWTQRWTEQDRKLKVRPFTLRGGPSQRVRVEPGERPLLVDALDGVIRINLTRRIRYAELAAGEAVYAVGELRVEGGGRSNAGGGAGDAGGGAYRAGEQRLVLYPLADQPMMLSTEPLGQRFAQRAAKHWGMARLFVAFAVIAHVLLLPYHLRLLFGEVVAAEVVKREIVTSTDEDGDTFQHHRLSVRFAGAEQPLVQEIGHIHYSRLAEGDTVPVLKPTVTFWPLTAERAASLGVKPTVRFVWSFALLVLALGMIIGYLVSIRKRPWWDKPVNQAMKGRLEESLKREKKEDAPPKG